MCMFSPLEQFNVITVIAIIYKLDFSFNNIILPLFAILIIIMAIYRIFYTSSLLLPSAFHFTVESLVEFVFSIVKQQIGKDGYVFFPLIFTIFIFVLLSNYLSLLPLGIALTSHIIVTLFLSLSLGLSIFILGLLVRNFEFFKNFIPQCPLLLLPMLILIELFSYVLRSFSLAIRLSANILAGHTLVHIIALAVFTLVSVKVWFYLVGFLLLFPFMVLEFCIAFLQAYVFCILICLYLREVYVSH